MKVIRTGITRTVILAGNCAIKVPSLRYRGRYFLQGLVANLTEAMKWDNEPSKKTSILCPVLWCSWGGFVLVMKRVEEIPDHDFVENAAHIHNRFSPYTPDIKLDNLGVLRGGRIVCIDYA